MTFLYRGRATLWLLDASREIVDVLVAAERLLTVTGNAVALCPTYGEPARP